MWKKLGVVLIALLSTFSVVYAMNRDMLGAGSPVNAPTYVNNLKQGSKIALGSESREFTVLDVDNPTGKVMILTSLNIGTVSTHTGAEATINALEVEYRLNELGIMLKRGDYHIYLFSLNDLSTNTVGFYTKYDKGVSQDKLKGTLTRSVLTNDYHWWLKETTTYTAGGNDELPRALCVESTGGYIFAMAASNSVNVAVRGGSFLDKDSIVYSLPVATAGNSTISSDLHPIDNNLEGKLATLNSSFGVAVNLKTGQSLSLIKDDPNDPLNGVRTFEYTSSGNVDNVSVIIKKDKSDDILLHGKVAVAGVGTVGLDFSTLTPGKYNVYFYSEKINANDANEASLPIGYVLDIVEPHKIIYASRPQSQSTYEYDKNVDKGDKVGELTRSDGVVPIHYEIVSDGDSSYQNFEIDRLDASGDSSATSLDVKVKASGAPDVVAGTNSLKVGTYKFCIESKDANGDPVAPVLGQSKVCTSMTVYPTKSQLLYTQDKNTITNSYYTKSELNALAIGAKVGSANFTKISPNDANIDILNGNGYIIKDIRLVSPGTTTDISELSIASTSDSYNYDIMKKSGATFNSGTITFDILVSFEHEGTTTAVIRKENQTFIVPEALNYADPDNSGSFLVGDTYEYTYNPAISAINEFILQATDNAVASNVNANVTYCIWDSGKKACDTSSVITLGTGTAAGKQKVIVSAPGTSDKTAIVRAMIKDSSNTILVYKDITIVIHPAKQSLTWVGTDINTVGNHVALKSGSTDTWKVALRYSGSGSDIYDIEELITASSSVSTKGKLGILSDIISGAPTYTLTMRYTNSSDNAKVFLQGSPGAQKLHISGVPTGSVSIKVESGAIGDYVASDPAYLELNLAEKLGITYTPLYNGNIIAGSNHATKNQEIGDVTMSPSSETGFTYTIESIVSSGITLNGTFVIPTGSSEVKVGTSDVGVGTYTVTIKATKGNETVTETITIVVTNANYDVSKFVWKQEDSLGAFTAVGGNINTTTYVNSKEAVNTYEPSSPLKTFKVKLDDLPTGTSVKSYAFTGTTTGVISVTSNANYATITINGASPLNADVKIKATITDSTGTYSDLEVYLPILINKYPQGIKFKDSNVLYLPNTAPCTKIEFDKTSTYWNQSKTNPVVLSSTSNAFTIAGDTICPILGKEDKNASLAANLQGDVNYDRAAEVTRTVQIYTPGSIVVSKSIEAITGASNNVSYTPGTLLEALNESTRNPLGTAKQNAIAANVKLNGIQAATKDAYKASSNSGTANIDVAQFSVLANGNVILNNDITASDILAHGSNIYKLQVEVKDIHNYVQTIDVQVKIEYAEPDFYFTDSLTVELPKNEMFHDGTTRVSNYDVVYAKNGTVDVYTNYMGTINYSVDAGGAQDVISQTQAQANSSQFSLDHATDLDVNGQPIADAYVKACRIQENGYKAKCIYTKVSVEKATQNLQFAANPLKIGKETTGFTPIYTGHEDGIGVIITNTTDPSIVEGEGSTTGQMNDESLRTGMMEGTAILSAYAQGNRDYKEATATTTVEITNKPPAKLVLKASPSSNITYGETNAYVEIIRNYDSSKPAYFWSDDDSIIKVIDATTSDNVTTQLEINKVGSTIINVCQTVGFKPGDSCSEEDFGFLQVSVSKASLTLKLSDKTIYTGETIPTYDFEPTPISGSFKGSDSITDFAIPASTRAVDGVVTVGNSEKAGTYTIKGSYSTAEQATAIVENYNVSIQDGTLDIKEDKSANSWYHLEDDNANVLTPGKWFNHDVNVVIDPTQAIGNAGTYDTISPDKKMWSKSSFLVDKEDENSTDIYFQIDPLGGTTHAGAIADKQSTTIKIDKTKPIVKSITGTQTNKDALSTLINNLTFGTFFKPGTLVSIKSEDVLPSPNVKVSGLQEVSYEVYEIDRKTGIINSTPLDTGKGIPDANGNIEVKLDDVGLYRVCALTKDNAGNVSTESCSDVNIKKIDVDIDNDGENEFQDPGNDGCPDINIALKDEKGVIYKINVDRDDDGIPDLNIDSDGDGIADIDVDTDKDGKPDLNLVILTKWEPTFCAKEQIDYEGNPIEYCTMKDIKAVINVDTGNDTAGSPLDGIPDIDIDTNGDMIADFNITKDGKTPSINIGKLHEWNPKNDCKKDEFQYDTIGEESVKVELNFDSDGDGRPDINLDPKGTGKPTLNIDINGDGVPDVDIDSDGDGIRDVNIDVDGNGIADENIVIISKWTPDKNVDILDGFPYDTMGDLKAKDTIIDEDTGIQIQKPGGSFLPNYSIKVNDVKDSIDSIEKDKIEEFVEDDMEIKEVYDVKLSDGTSSIQPDGSVKVRIPMNDEWKNAESVKVVIEQADGTYKEVIATVKDGYLEYETDFLGKVGIIADKSIKKDPDSDKSDVPIPDFTPNGSGGSTPDKTVKGNYTSGIGGAGTGDSTSLLTLICMGTISSYVIYRLKKKYY